MAEGYGRTANPVVLSLVPLGVTCLDIGCGEGGWAPDLRERGVTRLVGVESEPNLASVAAKSYDHVEVGSAETLDLASLGSFDLIVASDVLEHLVNPWSLIKRLRASATPGGHLLVSVPNARCIELVAPLVFKGRFDYDDRGGLLDSGHLRWFTRKTLDEALLRGGWRPEARRFVALGRRRMPNELLRRVGLPADVLARQLVVLARAI